ncbi:aspartate/glutamate racemase family protein [Aspergillus affinis]|uniref:aspartate/glutamate racemase family protein n=1 Tax=Aspergillus affinis TaxID=1070780 RepID=UPI0022FE66EE|nr:putative DCG1-like protein [Aspergillus affinis]KAI9036329.1 putative DCG1-like protein [Aspergillus affinis]
MASTTGRRFAILVINPNTSKHMTDALNPIVEKLSFSDVQFDYFTAPSESVTLPDGRTVDGVPSINSGEDSAKSALHCMPFVEPLIPKYDAFLVACYSAHPLVGMLKKAIINLEDSALPWDATEPAARRKCVTGIFEASVVTSLSLISSFQLVGDQGYGKTQAQDTFGIISTGNVWKEELSKAVAEMLIRSGDATNPTRRFAGVETTGLTAVELHTTPPAEVKRRISEATEKLIKSTPDPLTAICMGCAGMAGMEEAVREGCIKAYGPKQAKQVRIVDGVVAGAGLLVTACKAGF